MTRSVYAEFSWSQLLILEDKNVTFLPAQGEYLSHGPFTSCFDIKKEGLSVFVASLIFQMPLTQNSQYAKVGWYVLNSQKPWQFCCVRSWYIEMWKARYLRVFRKSSCYFKFFRKHNNNRKCTLSDYLNMIFHFPSPVQKYTRSV